MDTGLRRRNRGPQPVPTFEIGSDIESDADPEDLPATATSQEVEQYSPGATRGMQ